MADSPITSVPKTKSRETSFINTKLGSVNGIIATNSSSKQNSNSGKKTTPRVSTSNDPQLSIKVIPQNKYKSNRPPPLLQAHPIGRGSNRNHYTQVRAQYLKTMGGSDWGSEISDDVTMTDTFSMESVYTVEKVVALFDVSSYSREIVGFLNRLNFSLMNYENLREHNIKNYPQIAQTMPRMHKITPLGGFGNTGKFHFGMKMSQWENFFNNCLGWLFTLLPVLFLIAAAASKQFVTQFISFYCMFTLFCIMIMMLAIDFRNRQVFFDCKLCIPVPVTNENLKGLRNYFKDLNEENIRNLKSLKKRDRDWLVSIIQKGKSSEGSSRSKRPTIRVMFYSVEYYQKFIQAPRYKLYGVVFLNTAFMCICVVLSIRKLHLIKYWW